jgi:hypothetical protein
MKIPHRAVHDEKAPIRAAASDRTAGIRSVVIRVIRWSLVVGTMNRESAFGVDRRLLPICSHSPRAHEKRRDRPKRDQSRHFQVDTWQDSTRTLLILWGMDLMGVVVDRTQ